MSPLADPFLPVYARVMLAVLFAAMLAALGWALTILFTSPMGIVGVLLVISFQLVG